MFVCVNACAEPYRIEASAISSITVWKSCVASGNTGRTIRRKPYAATFDSTAENTASAGSGMFR